jgi:hypothetical protein
MRYSNVTEKEQKLFEDLSYEQRMILVSRYTSRLKASSEAMAALGRPRYGMPNGQHDKIPTKESCKCRISACKRSRACKGGRTDRDIERNRNQSPRLGNIALANHPFGRCEFGCCLLSDAGFYRTLLSLTATFR